MEKKNTKIGIITGTLSLILAAIPIYFAYETYLKGELEVIIEHTDKEHTLDNVTFLFELSLPKKRDIYAHTYYCHTPIFRNKKNRTIDGVEFKIYGTYDDVDVDVDATCDKEDGEFVFMTKDDIPAFGYLYDPLETIHIKQNTSRYKSTYASYSGELYAPSCSGELSIIYRYTYNRIKKSKTIVYDINIHSFDEVSSDDNLNMGKYIECRNDFLSDAKDNYELYLEELGGEYELDEEEKRQVCIIVGDTLVYVDNANFFNERYLDIDKTRSLENLGRIVVLKESK